MVDKCQTELESEVQRMCNLGTAIENKARNEGRVEGLGEGVDLVTKLVNILVKAKKFDDLEKCLKPQSTVINS